MDKHPRPGFYITSQESSCEWTETDMAEWFRSLGMEWTEETAKLYREHMAEFEADDTIGRKRALPMYQRIAIAAILGSWAIVSIALFLL